MVPVPSRGCRRTSLRGVRGAEGWAGGCARSQAGAREWMTSAAPLTSRSRAGGQARTSCDGRRPRRRARRSHPRSARRPRRRQRCSRRTSIRARWPRPRHQRLLAQGRLHRVGTLRREVLDRVIRTTVVPIQDRSVRAGGHHDPRVPAFREREKGFEPSTSTLARWQSENSEPSARGSAQGMVLATSAAYQASATSCAPAAFG